MWPLPRRRHSRDNSTVRADCDRSYGGNGSSIAPGALITVAGVTTASFDIVAAQVLSVTQTASPGDTFTMPKPMWMRPTQPEPSTLNWPIPNTPTPKVFPSTIRADADFISNGNRLSGRLMDRGVQSLSHGMGRSICSDGSDCHDIHLSAVWPTRIDHRRRQCDAIRTGCAGKQANAGVISEARQGYTTAPSPPVQFVASGGQCLQCHEHTRSDQQI